LAVTKEAGVDYREHGHDRAPTVWDERALLLLGVLMMQSQHGYQINDFIDRTLCRVARLKKPTAYALLDRLATAGFITVHAEQAGNRPPRKVYAITPAGRELFHQLLRENLTAVDEPTSAGDIGLILINHLDRAVALACLRRRLARLDILLAEQQAPPHGHAISLDLAVDHLLTVRRADRDWLATTIARRERVVGPAAPAGLEQA
jgi:DNA-binding PadR family transcriptional regulator